MLYSIYIYNIYYLCSLVDSSSQSLLGLTNSKSLASSELDILSSSKYGFVISLICVCPKKI